MVLYGLQGNSLGLLYALANKIAVLSQVYSTTGKQVFSPSSPSAALPNFLFQPTLCLMQNFSPITYPLKGIRWLLCECELVTTDSDCNMSSFVLFLVHVSCSLKSQYFSYRIPLRPRRTWAKPGNSLARNDRAQIARWNVCRHTNMVALWRE